MSNVELTVGGKAILTSGTVIVQNDEPIRMRPFGATGSYFLELRFVDDPNITKIIYRPEESGWVVELVGFKSDMPTANISPLYVANHLGRRVLLNLVVQVVGRAPVTRSIHYTLFDGGPVT